MRFIYVQGNLDCRYGTRGEEPSVEFTWEGYDELGEASGRGWAVLKNKTRLIGKLYFHADGGDGSASTAVHRKSMPQRKHAALGPAQK